MTDPTPPAPRAPGPPRVLLVDGDGGLQARAAALFSTGALRPAGASARFGGALRAVVAQAPDLLAIELTAAAALSAIEAIMAEAPVPVVVLQPGHRAPGEIESFRALALGALDVARLPAPPDEAGWAALRRTLLLLAGVRVVRHVQGARRRRREAKDHPGGGPPAFPLVAIAASLGGPRALSQVLRPLPATFGAPICVCQHITDGFTSGLAQWLAHETALQVAEAEDGELVHPGRVYVAPSRAHLRVDADGLLRLDRGPPVLGFRPSCDQLLTSVAEAFGAHAIGVVLTGMGKDGARGLEQIRVRGGRTIAQDEATSVVFGMPGEAVRLGAAERILPLDGIAAALQQWVEPC